MDVVLEAISFSPVAAERADTEFWADCVLPDDLDEKVTLRFSNYVRRCAEGREKAYREVKFADANGKFLQKKLTEILALPIDKENKKRVEKTQELADRLCSLMQKKSAASGAVFLIQAKVDGVPSIALVKLDLNPVEVVALHTKKDLHQILYQAFDRALPEGARYFRKGLLYPSRGDGDARSGQHDTSAVYWDTFVGVVPLQEAKKATQVLIETATKAAEHEGRKLREREVLELIDGLAEREATDAAEAAKSIKTTAGLSKRTASIKKMLEEQSRGRAFSQIARIKSITYRFRDNLRLKVPASIIRKQQISVEQKGSDVLIRIRESSFDWSEDLDDDL